MSSHRKLDKDAVDAAREFLLGRSAGPGSAPGRRGDDKRPGGPFGGQYRPPEAPAPPPVATAPPDAAAPAEASRLELSAPDIRRTDSGWRARCIHTRGVDSRHVNDARYGGYVGSFIAALEVRDGFYRERGMPIPGDVEAVFDGERVAPEIVRRKRSIVVRWQGQEHVVTGEDAEEIATEIALDLFVEFLGTLQVQAAAPPPPGDH